ncbi:MAG: mandelate racemase [Geminicoccaceae bacterium]|nr:mandelate racemase [Geminicoccaceae bacterium]
MAREAPSIERCSVRAFEVPTDAPEADGTLSWNSTTLVLVELEAGGTTGIGYTYAAAATAAFVREKLAGCVEGRGAFDIAGAFAAMLHAVRNDGRPGVASTAISAVDNAMWDLKARLLGLCVADLLGAARESVALYGSGGFTSYDDGRLQEQLGGWAARGFRFVKMKIGRDLERERTRIAAARRAIGDHCALFVDANGACTRKEALATAEAAAAQGVRWFEEPVSSDDLAGLRLMRDRAPPGMAIAAGEYGYDAWYFRRMLEAGAVDVLQADATRCGGITGFMQAAALAHAFQVPISAHCAPALHLHACTAALDAVHIEWFHDHVRLEHMLFDGAPEAVDGRASVARDRPGFGLSLRTADAERYEI